MGLEFPVPVALPSRKSGVSAQDSQTMDASHSLEINHLKDRGASVMTATISREELQEKIERQEPLVLVETLEELQYRQGHLPGAVNLPVNKVDEQAAELIPEQDSEVVVYCSGETCQAAKKAAEKLVQKGYVQVRHYVGGKQDWLDAGLPLEGSPQQAATTAGDTTATTAAAARK
jgi:rhodanese-related sulfurtransferase